MGHVVGIDLGTTYSAISVINELGKPEIILNREGERITPSVVLFQGDAPLVGSMAKRSVATAPDDVVQFVKRAMGDPSWKFETSSGQSYRPEDISAIILKRLKEDAELTLGEGAVTDAVITVPAYFDDARRKATIDAGQIAGLRVRRLLNEPTAAALAYGLDTAASGTLLVHDLGGGTFDVTVMRVGDGEFDVLATGGDRNLGGFEWDSTLMRWLNERCVEAGGPDLLADDELEAELREKAELAKRALTTVAKTSVTLGADGFATSVPLTRETFEDITAGLLGRTRDILLMVMDDAGVGWPEVDKILLVGGSTRMPMVKSLMESASGKTAERSINPDEIVALGAAIQGQLTELQEHPSLVPDVIGSERVVIRDVTSQSLGVVALHEVTGAPFNSIIVPHNSKVPTKRSNVYSTVNDDQTAIEVEVTEGDDEDLDYVQVVGRKELRIPPYPKGAPIEIFFAYDIDQTIYVEVVDLTTNEQLGAFEIDRIANLTNEEVAARQLAIRDLEVS